MMELLVPAPSREAVVAAVQNGADAVYIGLGGLSGCREAVNFSGAEFESTVAYCRVRGCRVVLDMDLLITDEELPKAAGLALRAQRAGVEAVLLRDWGLFHVLRRLLPEMPLYASPALGFRTPEDVDMAAALGFRRLLLPEELNLEEVRRLCGRDIEIALPVQGTVCAAAAGTCALSLLSGRNSADRGLCHAVCRERFTLSCRGERTPLSLRDRCLINALEGPREAGVSCVYLRSAAERPEYTAAFTKLYAEAIKDSKLPARQDLEKIESVFAPRGFSRGTEPAEPEPESPDRDTEKVCAELRRTYAPGTEVRRVPVRFGVQARGEHQRVRVGVLDEDGHNVVREGPVPVCCGEVPLEEEKLRELFYKTGGTPYRCTGVHLLEGEGLTVSKTELEIARRDVLEELSRRRAEPPKRKEGDYPPAPKSLKTADEPVVNFRFLFPEQMTSDMAAFAPRCVYAPAELLASRPELLAPFLEKEAVAVAVLPPAVSGEKEETELVALLQSLKEHGIDQVLVSTLGAAATAMRRGFTVRGDIGLNPMNAQSLQVLHSAGFRSAALSPQLSLGQVAAMEKPLPTELMIYGRLPAMIANTCLLKTAAGRCTCATPGQLADTRGGVWPVVKDFGCRNAVYSGKKLFLADRAADWKACGVRAVRLSFTTESPRECREVAAAYLAGSGYRPNGLTRGCCYKPVR